MKRFLKSILTLAEDSVVTGFTEALDSLRTENAELRERLVKLEKNIELHTESQIALAKCTQQIALSLSDVAKELGNVMVYIYETAPERSEVLFDDNYYESFDKKMFN